MKKKSLVVFSTLVLICIFTAAALASNPVKLLVNGEEIASGTPPQIINGRTMVPVRWVAEALGADVIWDEQHRTVNIEKPYFVASLPEAEAKLYPFEEINGMYNGFILEVQGKRQYFDWKNSSNPTFAPELLFNDINQDGEKELIIILTTGTGTGVHTEDIHLLKPDTFSEIDVEDPLDIIKQNVKTKIELNGDQVAIKIVIADEETVIYQDKEDAGLWFDNVGFENSFNYEVIDDKLMVNIRAQVSPGMFVGEIQAVYVLNEGNYMAETIKFEGLDNSI